MSSEVRIHPTAIVEDNVQLGAGTAIWDSVHIRHGASLGEQCIVGEKSYIAYDVQIGHRVKINAMVYVCYGVTIEDGVMVSAGTVFTNDQFPRATSPDLKSPLSSDPNAETLQTTVCRGATIGAGCVVGSGLIIGQFAMIGMGSVVTRDVPEFHLVLGNPARSVGCVCRCGKPLCKWTAGEPLDVQTVTCTKCSAGYRVDHGVVSDLTMESNSQAGCQK